MKKKKRNEKKERTCALFFLFFFVIKLKQNKFIDWFVFIINIYTSHLYVYLYISNTSWLIWSHIYLLIQHTHIHTPHLTPPHITHTFSHLLSPKSSYDLMWFHMGFHVIKCVKFMWFNSWNSCDFMSEITWEIICDHLRLFQPGRREVWPNSLSLL